MTPETEAKIRNVQKFGRYARQLCVLIGVIVGLSLPLTLLSIFAGPRMSSSKIRLGPYLVTGDQLITPQVKIWSIVVLTVYCLIVLSSVVHLYRLFNHLAAGEIYTKTNVRHIRWVGLLAMAMATWQLVLPPLTFALIEVGFLDRNLITVADGAASGGGALLFGVGGGQFSGFVMAALVLLASWIMDVGRETSEEAVGMRHDADLVI